MNGLTLIETDISGMFVVKCQQSFDLRGCFVKNFNAPVFEKYGIRFICRESFYSTSKKNVIRGMHFQVYPFDGYKLVTLIAGHVLDVVLDLRKESCSFGKHLAVEMHADHGDAVLIPPDCAHGFLALDDNCILNYQTGSEYSPQHDLGILYNSFGFDWPCSSPIISTRDQGHPTFSEYLESGNKKQ